MHFSCVFWKKCVLLQQIFCAKIVHFVEYSKHFVHFFAKNIQFYSMKAEEIAKRLTDFRKSQHITIKELSTKLNMELATLSAQLSGKRGVAVSTINGIIELYPQLSLEWVMLGRGNMFVSEEKHEHLTTHAEVAELKNLVAQKDEEIKCLNAQVEVLMRTLQGKKD